MKFFKPLPLSSRVSSGLLLLRLVAGLAFMHHGYTKIQNPFGWMGPNSTIPGVFQALAALSEFGGGLAWILGVLMPLACFGIACTMGVAIWTHAMVRHDPFVPKGGGPAYELASVYFCVAVLFVLAGPGRFALDAILFRSKEPGAEAMNLEKRRSTDDSEGNQQLLPEVPIQG